jgi:hypothetical protein
VTEFYLGRQLESDAQVRYDSSHLTTHGVVVGMTGSGKTGMALVLLEEALRAGVPVLAIDPKGDLGNLALTFPGLSAEEFTPWVDPSLAKREGLSVEALGAKTADRWERGLADWDLGGDALSALRQSADVTVYTPGSTAGVPLNVLGSLAAPADVGGEALSEEVAGLVAGLLGLLKIDADPLTSREHILLTNVIERAWTAGKDLDLAQLIMQVQQPPFRKLGVFDLDTFFPAKDRLALAMRLNALVATPSFAPWLEGAPVDIGSLLWTPEGKPRAAVVYLSHLSAEERQFVVTLLLSKVITWMQTLPGTSALRALVYMDEVFGFAPPSSSPPSKKPILTILKQARAFGVGLVLATQNPVDLDYKAMSNAGTWLIGRLQTERDKLRIVEALQAADGVANAGDLADRLGGLESRQFLLLDAKEPGPVVLRTRWAMSFLRGPLTRAELSRLKDEGSHDTQSGAPATPTGATPDAAEPPADDESAVAPQVAAGVSVRFLDPAAEWAEEVGAEPGGRRLEAAVVARVHLRFDDAKAGLDHEEEWEAIWFPLDGELNPEDAVSVDYDARDLLDEAPAGGRYVLPKAKIANKGYFKEAQRDLKRHLHRGRSVEILRNKALKLYGRVGEAEDAFTERCDRAARERSDAEAAKLGARYEKRFKSLRRAMEAVERKIERAEADQTSRKQDEVISGFGSILSAFFGGKTTTRKVASSVRSLSSKRSRTARGAHRIEESKQKLEDKQAELEDLEAELAEELEAIDARWAEAAAEVETLEVGLERNDVVVDELVLVWVPTA